MTGRKILLWITLLSNLLFSATPEQVEQYLLVSSAEEELLLLESQFSQMQNSFSTESNESKNSYDMQLLSVRFKEYLQKHLSEEEMNKVLENYKNVLLLQFVSARSSDEYDTNGTQIYIETLKEDPEANVRIALVEKISKLINNKDALAVMFDDLLKPLTQNASGGNKITDETMNKSREAYIKSMIARAKDETLYATKDFTIEELEELLTVAQTPAIGYEMKAVYEATAYALKEFFLSIASRYDVSKHMPNTNNTK